jgi:four helix bundle suffix protein
VENKSRERVGEIREIWGILKKTPTLPDSPNFPDLPNDLTKAVNLMITMINQAIYLQTKLIQSLEKKFIEKGGFRENLFKKRLERKRDF